MSQSKCAHQMCTCIVPDGSKYCCQSCEDNKNTTTIACDCKHPSCAATV
jgi:hypothetical protein